MSGPSDDRLRRAHRRVTADKRALEGELRVQGLELQLERLLLAEALRVILELRSELARRRADRP
jgi:hypothetical protein